MSYLSSHKNLFLSAAFALLILAIGLVVNKRSEQEPVVAPQNLSKQTTEISTTTSMTDRDSDVDGLPDWEEHLYGSDPLKFDSDGDGTPDGQEVKEGRNPAKASTAKAGEPENDMITLIQDPHFATSSTDILGIKKEFFAKFLANEGDQIRQATYKELLRSFDAKSVVPRNQIVDLNISSDNSPEALRAYGNAFGVIIKKYTKRTHRTEQEIVEDAIRSSSTPILKELQLPAVDYKNFSTDLKVLRTPSSMASFHLKIVNGYEQMSKGLILMQQLFTNPINGAGGYEAYTKGKVDVTDGYAHVLVLFVKENIAFTPDEPGAPFTYSSLGASTTSKQ
jgi:hypothetical protein